MATGANALVSIFSERESHAVWFLKSLNMTRLDAVSFISHGSESSVAKSSEEDTNQGTLGTLRAKIRFPNLLSILSRRQRQANRPIDWP